MYFFQFTYRGQGRIKDKIPCVCNEGIHSTLTGTPLSSCILYLSSAAGFPVRSRKIKKKLPLKKTTKGITDDPVEGLEQLGDDMIYVAMYAHKPTNDIHVEVALSKRLVEKSPN